MFCLVQNKTANRRLLSHSTMATIDRPCYLSPSQQHGGQSRAAHDKSWGWRSPVDEVELAWLRNPTDTLREHGVWKEEVKGNVSLVGPYGLPAVRFCSAS